MVARGELHLGAIHLMAKHLTDENHAAVLERAKHKSCREIEQLVAELVPRADVPSRIRALPGRRGGGLAMDQAAETGVASHAATSNAASKGTASSGAASSNAASSDKTLNDRSWNDRNSSGESSDRRPSARPESATVKRPVVALSPRRFKIEITVDEATHDKLRSLQDLLSRSGTGRDPAEIISRAIDVLLVRTLARKAGCTEPAEQTSTEQPAPSAREKRASKRSLVSAPSAFDIVAARRGPRTRTIPAAVRREVWRRDSGRCCYVDAHDRRCRETSNIEFHHRIAFAMGGLSTAENIELRCAAHNQLQAELDFGRPFMDAKREGRCRESGAM